MSISNQNYEIALKAITKRNYSQDSFQTALLELHSKGQLTGETRDIGAIVTVAKYRYLDELRRKKRHPLPMPFLSDIPATPHRAITPDEAELFDKARKVFSELPEPYRNILTRHFLTGESPQQISKALGRPLSTVYSQINRALKMCRQHPLFRDTDN